MTTDQPRAIMLQLQPIFHILNRKNGRIGLNVVAIDGSSFTGDGFIA